MTDSPALSVVVLCFSEEAVLDELHRRLTEVLAPSGLSYEFPLVDDGSCDGFAATMRALRARGRAPSSAPPPPASTG